MNGQALEARIVRLERQNRMLRNFVVLFLFAIAGSFIAGMQATVPPAPHEQQPVLIDGHEFRLLDKEGKPRAMIAMLDEGPAFILCDAQGGHRARLLLDEVNGPNLSMTDHNASTRISLGVRPTGAVLALADCNGADRLRAATGDNDATFVLFDHRHKSRARMALDEQGQPTLHLFTTDSLPLFSAITTEEGPSVAISDLKGHHIWCMPEGSQPEPATIVANNTEVAEE